MSAGTALAVIMAVGAAGILALVAVAGLVDRVSNRLPTVGETITGLVGVAVLMLATSMLIWPDMPAPPAGVTPTTYGPPPDVPRDLLSGEPL